MIEQEQIQRKRRQRLLTSLTSLLLLLLLLSAWCAVREVQQEGSASSSRRTATVEVAVNGTPGPGSGAGGSSGLGGRFNRQPPPLIDLLSGTATAQAAASATPGQGSLDVPEVPAGSDGPQPVVEPLPGDGSQPGAPPGAQGADSGPILSFDGLLTPGTYVTGGVLVTNLGPGDFNYSVTLATQGDAAFAGALQLRVFTDGSASCSYSGQPASGSGLSAAPGTVLYDGDFASGDKVGDPALEAAPGDLFLAANTNQALCMELFFPWDAGEELQGASVNGTFTFTAKSPDEGGGT